MLCVRCGLEQRRAAEYTVSLDNLFHDWAQGLYVT